ncbi:hypothetical protein WMY93_030672 [Mugilogobius chulae]|uniref:C-type lectin domain-containing protein n=1 Tax=Mugilogobius chulae TaxID=88201 RepID=A0AAW0MGY4_9GOBI
MDTSLSLLILSLCTTTVSQKHGYHFVNLNKTWSEAQTYCRDIYTDLATLSDQTEAERVCESECPVSGAWIGLHRPGTNSNRTWHGSQPALEHQENKQVWYNVITDKEPDNRSANTPVLVRLGKTRLEALYFCREHHIDLDLFRDSWVWSDGNNSSFRNWEASENVLSGDWNQTTPQCTRLSEQKRWKSEDCNEQRPFICYALPGSEPKYLLWLLLLIPVVTVMTSVLLVRISKKKRTQNDDEANIIGSTTEYENTRPAPKTKTARGPCPPPREAEHSRPLPLRDVAATYQNSEDTTGPDHLYHTPSF